MMRTTVARRLLIPALTALQARDSAALKRELERHSALVRLTPQQTTLLTAMEADTARPRVEWTYVFHPARTQSVPMRFVGSRIAERCPDKAVDSAPPG